MPHNVGDKAFEPKKVDTAGVRDIIYRMEALGLPGRIRYRLTRWVERVEKRQKGRA